jgi:hypothetical protein
MHMADDFIAYVQAYAFRFVDFPHLPAKSAVRYGAPTFVVEDMFKGVVEDILNGVLDGMVKWLGFSGLFE